jgi:signal transduction histidine kinase
VDVFQPEADAKGVTLQVSLQPGSWQLAGDPDRLQQVVWNLLANAMKFTPPGGCVTVLSRCRGADAIIEVRDTDRDRA